MSVFKVKNDNLIMTIQAPESLTSEESEEFKNFSNAWLLNTVECYVIDFKKTTEIDKSFYKVFVQFKKTVKQNSKLVFSINLSPKLLRQIIDHGMNQSFSLAASMADVKKKIGSDEE